MREAGASAARARRGFGVAGVAVIIAIQFVCFCLCGSGVKASVDPHAGCHETAAEARAGATALSTLGSPESDCCPRLESHAVVALNPQHSLSAAPSAASPAAVMVPAGPMTLKGALPAVAFRFSSPPRTLILRI